ncbi:LAMI_0H07712g1_1 [Lachancea mirantina]|uniref:Large ribosomal subunit protein bL21m n=1 Tax=Lachancea mirantina TaxID=1230905 RepID=A0A1G4KG50_9SACH|nr:LAMI_0H07712g1_1 [Lachancea mirantina]
MVGFLAQLRFGVRFPSGLNQCLTESVISSLTTRSFSTSVSLAQNIDTTPLKLSNELFATFRIHNRPYLVTKGDKVYLPFRMKQAEVGDVLNLNDVTTIASRNYQVVGYPIDPSLYTVKATVIEKTKRPMKVREVTKRRNRKVRHAETKADLTVLRISELSVK